MLLARVRIWHLLIAAAITRIGVLVFLPDQGFPDANAYRETGQALVETGFMSTVQYMPLYPLWMYLWGGGEMAKVADISLSVATVWIIYELAMVLMRSRQAALIAALIACFYPHFLFYAVSGLTETAYLFLVCLAFLALYRERYLFGMVLIVLSILIRPTLDLLAPLLLAAFVLAVHRGSLVKATKIIGLYAAVYVVLMAPWWYHNYVKYDAFVRLNLGDGIVLYSGNNPLNTSGGGVNYSPGEEGYDEHGLDRDMTRFEAIEDRVERNRALKEAAVDYIVENPGHFAELAAIKFVRFWRLWPYAPKYEKPHLIVASLLSYGVVLCLSLVYVFRCLKSRWHDLSPILLFIGYLTAVHMVTIGSIRYRLPLEPFLIVFAAPVLRDILQRLAGPRWVAAETQNEQITKTDTLERPGDL